MPPQPPRRRLAAKAALLLAMGLAAGCSALPDTVGQAAPSDTLWTLKDLNGAPAGFSASLRFGSGGSVSGTAPCNSFSARQTAPLPWFEIADLTATQRGCPLARDEAAFFQALRAMDFAEVADNSLLLSNDQGQTLFFQAAEGPAT
ncbi:MAG: META domain-containing protein [Pseudomonadota bacterium]